LVDCFLILAKQTNISAEKGSLKGQQQNTSILLVNKFSSAENQKPPEHTTMSEDSKRGSLGALAGKPSSDDRKSSPASSGKRVVIKSADMSDDMQKEAVDIAIAVRTLSLFC